MRRDLSGEASTWSATAFVRLASLQAAERCGAGAQVSGGGGVELAVAGGLAGEPPLRAPAPPAVLGLGGAFGTGSGTWGGGGGSEDAAASEGGEWTGDAIVLEPVNPWDDYNYGGSVAVHTRSASILPLLSRANLGRGDNSRDPLHKRAGYRPPRRGSSSSSSPSAKTSTAGPAGRHPSSPRPPPPPAPSRSHTSARTKS